MKGGKHGQSPRDKDAAAKPKIPVRGAPAKKSSDRPRSVAPKKGARKKSFGGSSSSDED